MKVCQQAAQSLINSRAKQLDEIWEHFLEKIQSIISSLKSIKILERHEESAGERVVQVRESNQHKLLPWPNVKVVEWHHRFCRTRLQFIQQGGSLHRASRQFIQSMGIIYISYSLNSHRNIKCKIGISRAYIFLFILIKQ